MISFTGSTAVGRAAMAAASATLKKVSMELGGKNPQVVFPDADMEAALDARPSAPISTPANAATPARACCLHAEIAEDSSAALCGADAAGQGRRSARSGDQGRRDHQRRPLAKIETPRRERRAQRRRRAADRRRAAGLERPVHGADDRRPRASLDGDRERRGVWARSSSR